MCACERRVGWGSIVLILQWVAAGLFGATTVLVLVFYHLLVLLDQNWIFCHLKDFLRSAGQTLFSGILLLMSSPVLSFCFRGQHFFKALADLRVEGPVVSVSGSFGCALRRTPRAECHCRAHRPVGGRLGVCVGVSSSHSTTYITCPADPKKTLGIKLPFLVMIIKNLKKYFTFEVQVSVCPGTYMLLAVPEGCPVSL